MKFDVIFKCSSSQIIDIVNASFNESVMQQIIDNLRHTSRIRYITIYHNIIIIYANWFTPISYTSTINNTPVSTIRRL